MRMGFAFMLSADSVERVDIWDGWETEGRASHVRIFPCRTSHSGSSCFFSICASNSCSAPPIHTYCLTMCAL